MIASLHTWHRRFSDISLAMAEEIGGFYEFGITIMSAFLERRHSTTKIRRNLELRRNVIRHVNTVLHTYKTHNVLRHPVPLNPLTVSQLCDMP